MKHSKRGTIINWIMINQMSRLKRQKAHSYKLFNKILHVSTESLKHCFGRPALAHLTGERRIYVYMMERPSIIASGPIFSGLVI